MKYYGEKTKRLYDTAEACERAEFEAKEAENREKIRKEREETERKEKAAKRAEERKARASEVEEARKTMIEAQNKYREVLEEFCKSFGSFHTSLTTSDIPSTLFDFLSWF